LLSEWVALSDTTLKLQPGQIQLIDLIIRPEPPVYQSRADANVRLIDIRNPEISLSLSLSVFFKKAPDLIGWLEPPATRDNRPVYLNLQNHTQGSMKVFISGHIRAKNIHVLPAYPEIELPAGQTAQIPVKFHVLKRSLLGGRSYSYSVSAQQGTRAPVDVVGKLWVRPRLSVLGLLILLVLLCIVSVLAAVSFSPFVANLLREAPTATLTPSITQKPASPTPEPTNTEIPPTPEPTPEPVQTEETLFTDPRAASCTVPIPEGWLPYTVQAGDTLFRLAMDHNTTIEEISRVNCITGLIANQVILLPPDP
jgi:LysM repeat protein